MREYSVVWLRQDNSTPRRKRLGPSKRRAESYLAAVQATTPEERYGGKVDKPICCDGWECGCDGKTWRDRWEEKFGRMLDGDDPVIKPLVYARIESRPVGKWEAVDGDGTMPQFAYGDMIAPPEFRDRPWMVVNSDRCVAEDMLSGTLRVYGPRWERIE